MIEEAIEFCKTLLQKFSRFTFDYHFLENHCHDIFYTITLAGMQQLDLLKGTVGLPKLVPGKLNTAHGNNKIQPMERDTEQPQEKETS